jgi:hypothetical protein
MFTQVGVGALVVAYTIMGASIFQVRYPDIIIYLGLKTRSINGLGEKRVRSNKCIAGFLDQLWHIGKDCSHKPFPPNCGIGFKTQSTLPWTS